MGAWVIYLPGMAGDNFFDRRCHRAMKEEGLDAAFHNWTHFRFPLRNLRDRRQHHAAAEALATTVQDAQLAGRQVLLVGHSTGCIVILETLEQLQLPVGLALLMAPAAWAGYDLRRALEGTQRLTAMHSPLDGVTSLGTLVGGTADGRYRLAGGWRGFRGPGREDPRLEQVAWRPAWIRLGHLGGHLGWLHPRFTRQVLAPRLREAGA